MIFSDIAGENGIFCDGDWIEKKDQDPNGEVRLIQLADIGAGEFLDKSNRFVSDATAERLNCTLLHEGDLLISRLGEPLCKACIFPLEGKYITAVDVAILRIKCAEVDARYLLYLINSPWFKEQIKEYESGTTRKRISRKNLDRTEMQFPPTSEQRRIVSRIEELFSELDNSVSTLQKTKKQLAVYRQAVLKEAFDSVKDVKNGTRIKDVCNDIKVGIVIKPTQYYVESGGVKAFRNANVRRNYVDDDNWALISKEGHEKNKKSIVHTDNLVIARSGANLGMAAVVPEKCDGFNAIDIVIAELNLNAADPHYLAYYVNSPYGLHVVNEYQHGGAQGHLNVKEFGLLPLILAPLSEQKNIVSEIESRLSVCDSIEHTVDTALLQAEAMRQSILKQAFEGRL